MFVIELDILIAIFKVLMLLHDYTLSGARQSAIVARAAAIMLLTILLDLNHVQVVQVLENGLRLAASFGYYIRGLAIVAVLRSLFRS